MGQAAYDRGRILKAAARATGRKRHRTAIRHYRRVLAVEPGSAEIHARVAPLLVRCRQPFDAWQSFRRAGRGFVKDGSTERALQTYRQAARLLPRQLEAWLALADLLRKLGREADALRALLDGASRLRKRGLTPEAIHLLRRARRIQPWHSQVVLDLARLLTRRDQFDEARLLLEGLALRCGRRKLRRVRAAQWQASPSPRNTWRWLKAALGLAPARRVARRRQGADDLPAAHPSSGPIVASLASRLG